jgi:hypothetical protein
MFWPVFGHFDMLVISRRNKKAAGQAPMTGKQRKPRKPPPLWQDYVEEHYDEERGAWVHDAGTFGDEPAEPEVRKLGRPSGSTNIDYTDMDLLNNCQSAFKTQKAMLDTIRYIYQQKHGHDPQPSTIKERMKRPTKRK